MRGGEVEHDRHRSLISFDEHSESLESILSYHRTDRDIFFFEPSSVRSACAIVVGYDV